MEDNLMTDRQLVLDFVGKLQYYLDERKAEGYPPRLDYAAEFTPAFVNSLKTAVANIQKYVEAENDYGFAIEICQHANILVLLEARGCYVGYHDTQFLAEGIKEVINIICHIEKIICGAVLGSMIQADFWHIYGKEIVRGKNTPNLEEKRPIPTNILQSKLSAAEGKYASSREPQRAKKGRPKGKKLAFADKIICEDKDGLLNKLHEVCDAQEFGTAFKTIAVYIGVAERYKLIDGVKKRDVEKEFGVSGGSQYYRYIKKNTSEVKVYFRKKAEKDLKPFADGQ